MEILGESLLVINWNHGLCRARFCPYLRGMLQIQSDVELMATMGLRPRTDVLNYSDTCTENTTQLLTSWQVGNRTVLICRGTCGLCRICACTSTGEYRHTMIRMWLDCLRCRGDHNGCARGIEARTLQFEIGPMAEFISRIMTYDETLI